MKLFLYKIKALLSFREAAIGIAAVVLAASTGFAAFTFMEKDVNIYVDGQHYSVRTTGPTVEDAVREAGIILGPDDYISVLRATPIFSGSVDTVYVKKAKYIDIEYAGLRQTLPSVRTYVMDFLTDHEMTVDPDDHLEGFKLSDRIKDGMKIRIIKVEKKVEFEYEELEFETVIKYSDRMEHDKSIVNVPGIKGLAEHVYTVVYENGKMISRSKEYEQTLRMSQTQQETHGTIKTYITESGHKIRYTKVIEVRMTAYTASLKDTGKDVDHPMFGVTFTGRYVEPGIVAVDPKTIKLNTKMYVEIDGRTPDYGFSLAADTGGAIKDDLIDLYFDTQSFVDRWGTKWGRVYILAFDDPNRHLCPD